MTDKFSLDNSVNVNVGRLSQKRHRGSPTDRLMTRNLTLVLAFSIGGQAIAYFLAILLARQLGVAGFEAYVVAAATFIVLVAVAPGGIDKFSLRLVPALIIEKDWRRTRGFLAFGVRRTLVSAIGLMALVGVVVWSSGTITSATGRALLITGLALPAGALAHFGFEVLAATGRVTLSAAISRLAIPATVLVLVGLQLAMPVAITAAMAIGAWAITWIAAVVVLAVAIHRTIPPPVWQDEAEEDAPAWTREATVFWVHRVAVAVMAQASVIALELLQPSAAAVGAYAAALATASPALVLVTATNRIYARELSEFLARRDFAGIIQLRRSRLRWLLPALFVFLVLTVFFAEQILGLFGSAFIEDGAFPLRLIAITMAFTLTFALSPTYLKYTRNHRATLSTVALAAVAQLVLLWLLIPRLGATGAAMAYAVSMGGMYGVFALLASRDLASLRRKTAPRR